MSMCAPRSTSPARRWLTRFSSSGHRPVRSSRSRSGPAAMAGRPRVSSRPGYRVRHGIDLVRGSAASSPGPPSASWSPAAEPAPRRPETGAAEPPSTRRPRPAASGHPPDSALASAWPACSGLVNVGPAAAIRGGDHLTDPGGQPGPVGVPADRDPHDPARKRRRTLRSWHAFAAKARSAEAARAHQPRGQCHRPRTGSGQRRPRPRPAPRGPPSPGPRAPATATGPASGPRGPPPMPGTGPKGAHDRRQPATPR